MQDITDITDMKIECGNCGHELGVIYNTPIPFEGHFDVRCPECGYFLNKREDFILYKWIDIDK